MAYNLGIDLGGTKIAAGIVDEHFTLLRSATCPTGAGRPLYEVLDDVEMVSRKVLDEFGIGLDQIESIGMGTPSTINPATGLLVFANAMGWRNAPIRDEMEKRFQRPVYFANDADCAALGEMLAGAAQGVSDVLMITLGTGVGGGIILGGQLYNGCDRMGAEIGHITLVFDGERCTCGKLGCFEAYASGTALERQIRAAAREHPESLLADCIDSSTEAFSARVVFESARQGDRTAFEVIDRYTAYVAAGISSLVTIFRPKLILIGGGICSQGESLLGPISKKLSQYVYAYAEIGAPPVKPATLGNAAGIIGAAMVEAFRNPACQG